MKSFLVDVLRQAEGDDRDDATEKTRTAGTEKSLLASTDVRHAGRTEFRELEIQEHAVEDSEIELADTIGDLETIIQTSAFDTSRFEATSLLKARGVVSTGRKSTIVRVGRLTPVLCLVAMSIAAGGYVTLNRLAFNNLNEDLDELSERVRRDSDAGIGPGAWQDLPVTDVSVINEIAGRKANRIESASPRPGQSEAPVAVGLLPRTGTSGPENQLNDSRTGIRVTSNANSVVNDRAYSSVVAAYDAYREQDYRQAETYYLRALEIEPFHADALAGLAAVYQQTGRIERATETYQKILDYDPENTLAASAIISQRSKDADWDAESGLKVLLQRFPNSHHLHYVLGSNFAKESRWADARHEFLAAYRLAPRNADYSFNVAVSMEKLGDYNEARNYYEVALATAGNGSNFDKEVVAQHLSQMTAQLRERL